MAQAGEFVAFLPGDNQDLASPSTHAVIELINADLSKLLRLPPQQFWQVVLTDKSLHICLDSFLRFRRRCYDEVPDSVQGSSDLLLQLSQRVFRIYWRIVHTADSSNGHAISYAKQQQPQQPAVEARQIAEQLYNNWLVDVPKMLDIAVLYGPSSSKLTGQLLKQLLYLQPTYAQDICQLAEPLAGNLQEVCNTVERLATSALSSTQDSEKLLPELAEAVKYIMDACLTLQAFTECLPEAAALLLHPSNHGAMLLALALLHDTLLPLLQRVSTQPCAAVVAGLRPDRIVRLQQALVSCVYHILQAAFCTAEGAAASAGPDTIAAQAACNSQASSSNGSNRTNLQPSASSQQSFDDDRQGQELMNLVMLLAHPSDQQQNAGNGRSSKPGLLVAVNQQHQLDVTVADAVDQGLLAFDDAQFDYFLALIDGDRQLLQRRQQQCTQASAMGNTAAAHSSSGSSQQPLPSGLVDQIKSIKELLPDYGDGYLTAALYHNSWNTEQTINCLLESSLPKALQGLDPTLQCWTPFSNPSSSTSSSSSRSHGSQGTATGSRNLGPTAAAAAGPSNKSLSWTGLASETKAVAAAAPGPAAVPLPSLVQAAASGPKAAMDRRTGLVLGAVSGQIRSVTKNIAQELQYEYDDEYDDSFDDLMGPGNDGVCDIEGDDSAAEQQRRGDNRRCTGVRLPAAAVTAAGGADEYADEPISNMGRGGDSGRDAGFTSNSGSNRPGSSSSSRAPTGQQQQQQRGRQQQMDKLWVLDGKVYNYKKDGAVEVQGQAGAQQALKGAKQAAMEIYGLGPGGNVPLQETQQLSSSRKAANTAAGKRSTNAAESSTGGADGAAAASKGQNEQRQGAAAGRGRGQGSQGRGDAGAAEGRGAGRGRGRGSYDHKEQHKAAVANHHRKDRAYAKQAKGML